jgi:hypothetical protein
VCYVVYTMTMVEALKRGLTDRLGSRDSGGGGELVR